MIATHVGLRAGAGIALLGLEFWALAASPAVAPQATGRWIAPARSRPAAPVLFQPGVWIDWQRSEVRVESRVVLRSGVLEFVACWPGKEHESILRCAAKAAHVYMALGLIGLTPGHPPTFEPRSETLAGPTGDLVDVSVEWEQEGQTLTSSIYGWLRDIEYGHMPLPRPWVFAGSLWLTDGRLSADLTGVGIAVVDFPDSLLAPAQRHSSRNAELWVEANTAVIPSEGTPVRLILRPATVRRYEVALDFRGDFWTDGRYCRLADLAELVHAARQLDPAYVQTVTVRGALRSDERWAERALHEVGIPAEALVLQRAEPSGAAGARADRPARFPPADPSGGD